MMAKVGTAERKNVSKWSLPMTMTTSGLVSSSVLPSSRMAAISASSCAGSSVGGRVNNCGACTVAIAATIFPMAWTYPLDFFIRELDAKFFQRCPQTVEIETQLAAAQALSGLLFFGYAPGCQFRDFLSAVPRHYDDAVVIRNNHIAWIHD